MSPSSRRWNILAALAAVAAVAGAAWLGMESGPAPPPPIPPAGAGATTPATPVDAPAPSPDPGARGADPGPLRRGGGAVGGRPYSSCSGGARTFMKKP